MSLLSSLQSAQIAPLPQSAYIPTIDEHVSQLVKKRHARYWRDVRRKAPWTRRTARDIYISEWREAISQLGSARIVGDWDTWSPGRREPSGCHPMDGRGVPDQLLWCVPARDVPREPVTLRRPSWRVPHQEVEEGCEGCQHARVLILGSYGLTPSSRPATRPRLKTRRITREAAERRRARRMATREYPADHGNDLTEQECGTLLHISHKAALCGSAVAIVERRLPTAGEHLERSAVPMSCGVRDCERCFARARDEATIRMDGPWNQFVTLTLRRERFSRYHAWRNGSKWISELMERIAASVRKGCRECLCVAGAKRKRHPETVCPDGKLEYAWAMEPHEIPWPHWHIAWNATYVCFDLVREWWEEITGAGSCGTYVEKVTTPERISRYMAEYMTKAKFSSGLLALMYRKRLYASTMPARPEWRSGFQVVGIASKERAWGLMAEGRIEAAGLDTKSGLPSRYWQKTRFIRGVILSWELSDVAFDAAREAGCADATERARERWRGSLEEGKKKSRARPVGRLEMIDAAGQRAIDRVRGTVLYCRKKAAPPPFPGVATLAPGMDRKLRQSTPDESWFTNPPKPADV